MSGRLNDMDGISRRRFTSCLASGAAAAALRRESLADTPDELIEDRDIGPLVGHVSDSEANVWFRPRKAGRYVLTAYEADSQRQLHAVAEATLNSDLCIKWSHRGLKPST